MTASKSVNSFGNIDYGASGAQLLLRSSFEEPPRVVLSSSDCYLGNFPVASYIDLQYYSLKAQSAWDSGCIAWVEDALDPTTGAPVPRSGRYCIGLRTPSGAGRPLRSELELTHLDGSSGMGGIPGINLAGKEVFVSTWLYLPSDWTLGTTSDYDWYEIVNCYCVNSGGYPRICVHIHHSGGVWSFAVEYDDNTSWHGIIGEIDNFVVPLGEWFNLRWWFTQQISGGRLKFWIKTSVYDEFFDSINNFPDGLQTLGSSSSNIVIVGKSYLNNLASGTEHKIWVDDVEVWDGIP